MKSISHFKGGVFLIHIFPVKNIIFCKKFSPKEVGPYYSESKYNKEENEARLFEEQFSTGR